MFGEELKRIRRLSLRAGSALSRVRSVKLGIVYRGAAVGYCRLWLLVRSARPRDGRRIFVPVGPRLVPGDQFGRCDQSGWLDS